ncbi:putative DnaJ subfamily C member 7 [Cocos nucifera]|uniref:Putative DnaJ subfamily C member 7 n=1 Tax=Cocos nucifera TaxID=13894 RepID=A0A8K0IYR3_COCNU|nr:putative DnaJ subfamily C member 7 [Cocos nucifera]
MPPAIVDFRTPAAASPQVRPKGFSSQNSRKGQIPAPPSPFSFDPASISATDRPYPAASARPMDRTNLGRSFPGSWNSIDDGFGGGFASSTPFSPSPSPSVSASGEPSPAAGLSKPRLVKVRKHFASPRVRPAVASEGADDSGFNPFRSAQAGLAAEAADQEGGGMQGLNEKLHSWKPFNLESGIRVPENSSGPNSSSFEPLKSESAGSTGAADQEGGGMRGLNEKLHSWKPFNLESGIRVPESSSGPKSSSFGPVKSESAGFVFGAGSASKPSINIGYENAIDRAFGFGVEGSRGFDAGPSVFGSGVKKNSDSEPSSSENLSGPNLGSFEYVKPESSGFVFVVGSASNQSKKNIGSGNSVDRAYSFSSVGSVGSETGVFMVGSGVNMSSDLRWNSPENSSGLNLGNLESVKSESADFIFGASSVSHSNKPDHTFNFASKDSSNSDPCALIPGSSPEKSSNLSQNLSGNSTGPNMGSFKTGNSESTAFVFGSNAGSFSDIKSVGSGSAVGAATDGGGKSDSGVFVFGSGTQKGASSSQNWAEISGIPNLGSSESVKPENAHVIFGASSTSNMGCRTMGSGNTLGGEFSFTSGRSVNTDTGVFVFGSHMRKGSNNLSQSSSLSSEQGPFSKLPDEMRKLNLQSSSNEEGFEKTKQRDNRAKVDQSNVFIFGGNQNDPSSIGGGAVNMLPEEMKKLDIGSATASKNAKNERVDQTANMFAFGSNMKKTSASNQTSANSFTSFEKSTCSKLPNDMQKLNTDGLRNDDSFRKAENTDYQFKVDVSNGPDGLTFPCNKDVPGSFEGNGVNTLHNDMEKLDINKPENSTGKIDQTDHSAGDAYTSFKFTFQAGKQGANSTMGHVPPSKTQEHFTSSGVPMPSFYPSSSGPGFQSVGTECTFTSKYGGPETPHMEFRTHKQDGHGLAKENLFTGPHHNMAFNVKKGDVQSTRTKKRRGKSRQSGPAHPTFSKPFISMEKSPLENMKPGSPGGYSPMDYSPYQENLGADQCSREASVASGESIHIFSRCASADTERSFSVDEREEDLVSATKCLNINEDDRKHDSDFSKSHIEKNFAAKSSVIDEQNSGPGRESLFFKSNSGRLSSDTNNAAMEAETGSFGSNFERQTSEGGTCFTFVTSSEDFGGSNFAFAAPTFAQGPLSAAKRHHRRKSRMKTDHDLYTSTSNASAPLASPSPNLFSVSSTSMQPDPAQDMKVLPSFHQGGDDIRAETNRKPESNKEDLTKDLASVAAEEACDKWRLRGNQAYANGHPSKAEEYYTRGVNSISPIETSRNCSRALMLCYSNRAATRMSLGRMREALNDCMMAIAINPSFLRAQVRAANCHLALGDIEDALEHFKKCLQSDDDASLGQKILLEASEGLRKAQQVADYIVQAKELMLKRTPNEVTKALQFISEALSISPHSENLLEMKAEALLMLHNYEEVIQLCEQSLDSAERNSFLAGSDDQLENLDSSGCTKGSLVKLWRWRLISKSYFYLGKLEESLELLRKHEQVKPIGERCGDKSAETSASLFVTVRELLRLKAAGNEAFQAGRRLEAVEHYTAALACNTESRPFTAVCFCNRAAAYQALGQITDAIADCSLAIALDPSYPKAISRRATLHEMIRDYGQAANDLHRLISFLEKQLTSKGNQSRGIEQSSSAADVKKAYRKAALKHHPDKAGQFLARSENADDGLWREVADEVYKDADRLFKMIGEAYTILSDPAKRLQYDAEEEIRTTLTKGYNMSRTPKTPADNYSSHYEKRSNMHQWRSYGSPHKRWTTIMVLNPF